MRFNASLTQSEDKGIIMGSGVRRTNLNIKTAIDITKNLTLQINPKFSFRRDEGAGGDNIGTGGIIDVLRYRPTNGLREFGYIDPSYADPDEEALSPIPILRAISALTSRKVFIQLYQCFLFGMETDQRSGTPF